MNAGIVIIGRGVQLVGEPVQQLRKRDDPGHP